MSLAMILESDAFSQSASIPVRYTCDGEDISPPLSWSSVPQGTKSLALIMDDPDSPTGIWDHWVLFNIDPNIRSFMEGMSSGVAGENTWGKNAYGGPCPGAGEHRYIFKLYALDSMLPLSVGADKSAVESAMKGHIIATGTLMGRYRRLGR